MISRLEVYLASLYGLTYSLLAWAALHAFEEVVDSRNAAVAAWWARNALRGALDDRTVGVLAGITR